MLTKIQDPVWIGQLNRYLGIKMALIIFSYLNFCVDFWRPFLAFQCKKTYGTYLVYLFIYYYYYYYLFIYLVYVLVLFSSTLLQVHVKKFSDGD